MCKKLLLFLLFILFSGQVIAGSKGLELIHADRTVGQKVNGEQIRFFEGNIHFRQDTLDMYCDRAFFYPEKNRADFIGNVHIEDGHRDLWADKIEYYPQTKQADCFGNVKIDEQENHLRAKETSFNFESEEAFAREDLFIYNKKNRVKVWGQFGHYKAREKFSEVQSNARLTQLDSSGTDSMTVTAGKLEYFRDPPERALATDSVVIIRGALKASCDSAIVFPERKIAWLKVKPVAWYEDNELTGTTIKLGFDSTGIRTIDVSENGKARNLADSLEGNWNKLLGKHIHMDVLEDKPQVLIASGNATSNYYLEESSSDPGMNFATADTISVYFKESQADSIRIVGGAQGTYYPKSYKGAREGEE